MAGHRPDGNLPPYYSGPKPEHCECGAELQYDGDYTEQYWSAVTGDPSEPCPVWDAPYGHAEVTDRIALARKTDAELQATVDDFLRD